MRLLYLLLLLPVLAFAQAEDTTTPIIWVEYDVDPTPCTVNGQTLRYPEVMASTTEVVTRQNDKSTDPASRTSRGISGPGRLMRRDPLGNVTTIYNGATATLKPGEVIVSPADPKLSFDGRYIAATLYYGNLEITPCAGANNKLIGGSNAGARVIIYDLQTQTLTEWPNTVGTHDLTPAFINQGGVVKVMFASDRDNEWPPRIRRVSINGLLDQPNLQTFIANIDGTGVTKVGYQDFTANYGFNQLKDGRVISSCAQWTHDLPFKNDGQPYTNHISTLQNMWWACGQDPWGGSQESLYGAHGSNHRALHFFGQLTDGRILVNEYYRNNDQQASGTIFAFAPQPFTIEGIPIAESIGVSKTMLPRDFIDVFPWARSEDNVSWFDESRSVYQGRVRSPFGLPINELGFVWCRGTCNNQGGWMGNGQVEPTVNQKIEFGYSNGAPVADPIGTELGIYKLASTTIPSNDYVNDPIKLRDVRYVHEYDAIYGGPYVDVYGQAMPDTVAQPTSGDANCYLHIASQQSDTVGYRELNGILKFGTEDDKPVFGKQMTGTVDADVKYIRITKAIPNATIQSNFAGQGSVPFSMPGYKTEILGEAAVETDGSLKVQIPCDTPFTLTGLNQDKETVKRDMMVQSLRPGTVLECGGCHLHNDVSTQPSFTGTIADQNAAKTLQNARASLEYSADIAPIINNRCASCHNGQSAQASIDFNAGTATRTMIAEDYEQAQNPNPTIVSSSYSLATRVYLDTPHASWLVNGSYSANSPFYWYFKGERADNWTNGTSTSDINFNTSHPSVGATSTEIATIRDWIDSGVYFDPTVAIPPFVGQTFFLPSNDTYVIATNQDLVKGKGKNRTPPPSGNSPFNGDKTPQQPTGLVTADNANPAAQGNIGGPAEWAQYSGSIDTFNDNGYFTEQSLTSMYWNYSRTNVGGDAPTSMRMLIRYHNSAAGKAPTFYSTVYAPFSPKDNQIEVRYVDAEQFSGSFREWHVMGTDGVRYPIRRVGAIIEYLNTIYPGQIDYDNQGMILWGNSMGGGGSYWQAMAMADPWRQYIAYISGGIGGPIPRTHAFHYNGLWPADEGYGNNGAWDSVEFRIQAQTDPIVRGIHYRHRWSTNDDAWLTGPFEFLNPVCEDQKIACSWTWMNNGHSPSEPGYKRMMEQFLEQDVTNSGAVAGYTVTVDRAHPAFTKSTGNYPVVAPGGVYDVAATQAARLDVATNPRGHYNAGLYWDNDLTVDTATEIRFSIRYEAFKAIGPGIPDQPDNITVSVTPRRPKNFVINDGEVINWSWDNGALTGTATVVNDTVTVDNIPLVSGQALKTLRFFK